VAPAGRAPTSSSCDEILVVPPAAPQEPRPLSTLPGADGHHGRVRPHDPELDRWDPLSVAALRPLLGSAAARWWISGGVALDLFLGRTTRPHGDLDVSVARPDWPVVAAELGRHLQLCPVADGWIDETGELTADRVDSLWCRPAAGGPWCLQVLLEEVEDDDWVYRRDPRVRLPLGTATGVVEGVPVVDPAVQLLWKSAAPRPQDDADRRLVEPLLGTGRRSWLAAAIALAHPGSPWATA